MRYQLSFKKEKMKNSTAVQALVITPEALQQHWQGHRNLTRRVIEAFPEKELFQFSIGGMRSFSDMASELIGISYLVPE